MDTNQQAALAAGTVLQGATAYTIEGVLGTGGFGITYLAVTDVPWGSVTIRRRVALKEHFYSDFSERDSDGRTVLIVGTARIRETVAGSLDDFLAEARRLQGLGDVSPNIVKVSDVFQANGTAYYAMEYLEGITLGGAVMGHPVSEQQMLAVMTPIIGAVAALHSRRMNHLDIKPENIVLAEGGMRPVLIDFGQSKHFGSDGHSTSTVKVKGVSHGYAPAEQYDGIRTYSPTADVYALGATMMACLTGTVPPKAIEWQAGAKAKAVDTLPASAATRTVIARALASDPAERYPDAGAMLAALTDSGTGGKPTEPFNVPDHTATTPITAASQPERRSFKWLIIAVVAALLVAAGAYFGMHSGNAPEPEPAPVAYGVWENHRIPHNLYLAVTRGGDYYYFSESDWNALSSTQRGECTKQGVVIDKDGQRFILALNDDPGEYNWNKAMSRFGNRLPTKEQGEAWISQQDAVQRAVRAFGGTMPGPNDKYYSNVYNSNQYYWYWTRTEYDFSYAWSVNMNNGLVTYTNKTYTLRVRAVVPVPVASAI